MALVKRKHDRDQGETVEYQMDQLLKRRREEFVVQGQLLHFQEDSVTDERRQIKGEGEVAIFIAVDICVVFFFRFIDQFNWPVCSNDKRMLIVCCFDHECLHQLQTCEGTTQE